MSSPVRASTRISIAWSGAGAYEDTDTLVLTINGWSLDLRVYSSGPHKGGVEWATVGNVIELEGSTDDKPMLRWDHIIDTHPPSTVPDQGSFTTLPNGDVSETGVMHNLATGKTEPYEEVWRRFSREEGGHCVLERVGGDGGAKAFVGRVGSRALGLGMDADGVFTGWREEKGGSGWRRVYEFNGDDGNARLPSLPDPIPVEWKEGQEVELGGSAWIVRTVGRL